MAFSILRRTSASLFRSQISKKPFQIACISDHERSLIGRREIVGYGFNGQPCYADRVDFPFPAIRWKEPTPEIEALREKEKGDWNELTCEEKKALYRSFSDFSKQQKHEFISKHFSRDCAVVLENVQSTDSPERTNTAIYLKAHGKLGLSDKIEADHTSNEYVEDSQKYTYSNSYSCSTCNEYFSNLQSFKVHKHKPFVCKYFCAKCAKKFNTKNGFMVHIMQHDLRQPAGILGPAICSIKPKTLKNGIEECAGENNEDNTQRDSCSSFDSVTDSDLKSRENYTHSQDIITHVCCVCCDGFTSLESLNDHKSLHIVSAPNDQTATVKKEPPDADDEEICIKSEPLEADVKVEDSTLDYDESFNVSSNFNSTANSTATSIHTPSIPGKDASLIDNPLSVAQTVPPDIGASPVVPMLMPILPECPPYFIYGNNVYIRIAQINTGPPVVAGTIGNPTVVQNCATQEVLQNDVVNSNTSVTLPDPASSVPVKSSSQISRATRKSILPKPVIKPRKENQQVDKVVKFTVVPDGGGESPSKTSYKLVRNDSDDEVEIVSTPETKHSTNVGVLRKTRSAVTRVNLKVQDEIGLSKIRLQRQPSNAKEGGQNSSPKASPKNKTKIANQDAGRNRKNNSDIATNLPQKRHSKNEHIMNPSVKEKSNKRISSSKSSSKNTRKCENKLQSSTVKRTRKSSPANSNVINCPSSASESSKDKSIGLTPIIMNIQSLSVSQSGENVAEVIDISSSETEETPSLKGKSKISQKTELNVTKEKEHPLLKTNDENMSKADNRETTKNVNPPGTDSKKKAARYRCSICKARFDNFPAVREHCREVHSLLNKS